MQEVGGSNPDRVKVVSGFLPRVVRSVFDLGMKVEQQAKTSCFSGLKYLVIIIIGKLG